MNITKYLNLVFKTTEDSTSTIKIPKVKEDITEEKIKNCGKTIVDQNIFQTKNGDLSVLKVARIITTVKIVITSDTAIEAVFSHKDRLL